VIASARRRAVEVGDVALAPPVELAQCDRSTIELALGKPHAGFGGTELYDDFPAKIAALLYGLSKSQACSDGNKRVALLLTVAFVRMNDAYLAVEKGELAGEILRIAGTEAHNHDAVIAEVRDWVAARLVEVES
jgi:prophage maintenance system killer protein